MSDRMPEDLPVTKRINVMVGMTRSKVIILYIYTYMYYYVLQFASGLQPRLRPTDNILGHWSTLNLGSSSCKVVTTGWCPPVISSFIPSDYLT